MKQASWSDALRAERERLGVSQAEAARAVGVSRATWCLWESGGRSPSVESRLAVEAWSAGRVRASRGATPALRRLLAVGRAA